MMGWGMNLDKLHKYQETAVDYALDKIISYMMIGAGLGKTAIALTAIQRIGLPAIVFAPLRVATITWPDEIKKWTPELSYTILHGKYKDDKLTLDKDIYIVSYTSLKWFHGKVADDRFRIRNYFLVVDESSMLRNPSTQRFKLLRQLLPMFQSYRINLSATPNPNGYHELWSQYCILDDGERLGDTYYSFRSRHFNYHGPPIFKTELLKGHGPKILNKIQDITFRLSAKDYLELPPILYNRVMVEMPNRLKSAYKKLKKEFILNLPSEQIAAFSESMLLMKLRQFVQGAMYTSTGYDVIHKLKIAALKELMEIHSGNSILCAIQFKFEYDMITKEFGNDIPIIAGKTTTKNSIKYIQRWNENKIPLLLCHPLSLSHGVNLQSGGNIVLWYGLPWSLEQYHQLNARLHRQGQKNAVVVNNIILRGTIDEVIFKVLKRKDATMRELLDAIINHF